MDNMLWTYFQKLIAISNISNLDIEIPVTNSLEYFLLNREKGNFLLSHNLTSLPILKAKKAYEQAKNSGVHSLYVGYPYLQVKSIDGSHLNKPLLLFSVNIIPRNSIWYITNNKEMNVMLNYQLLNDFFIASNMGFGFFQKEFKDLNQFGEDKLAGILAFLKENNINTEDNSRFIINNKSSLCLVSSSFSLLKDYETILSNNIDSSLYNSLINGKPLEKLNLDNIGVKDTFLISNLNLSQANAVAASYLLNQVLITGAKGNGKKETVSNIISDSLSKGKNILVISENSEALISIYERLGKIDNRICLLLKDNYHILNKINTEINVKREKKNDRILSQIKSKSESLEKKVKSIREMEDILYKKRPFGLSLQEMYSMTEAISNKDDSRYEPFKVFISKKPFNGFSYYQLKASIEKLGNEVLCKYQDYRNMLEDYSYLLKLKIEADISKCEYIYENRDDIKAAFGSLYLNIKGLEHFSQVSKLFLNNNFNINKQDIINLAEKILNNSKKDSPSKSENKLMHFIKYKSRKYDDIFRKDLEEKSEMLLAYRDMITNYLETISVIKEVLDKDFYNYLIEDALNGINVNEAVNILSESIGKFNNYKEYAGFLTDLEPLDLSILSYVYENSIPPFDEIMLLNSILDFSILSQIKDIESKSNEKKSLFIYLKYNELKDSILSYRTEKNSLTYDYINQVWDNKLIDLSLSEEYKNLVKDLSFKNDLSIKALFKNYNKILLTLFPVVLSSPEAASDILPLENMFSSIIYLDSSQLSINRAIPSLFRGEKLVVSGDTMSITNDNCLLNKSINKFNNIFLNYNYSSEREDILKFSNERFYQNSIVIPADLRKYEDCTALELINIENALDLICEIIIEGNLNKIGIIVFNEETKKYINREFTKREIYISNSDYICTSEEAFYSDRETVFIFTSDFSSIESPYKYNILNIAIASARRKIYIVDEEDNDEIIKEFKSSVLNKQKHTEILETNKEWLKNKLISLGYNISADLGYPPFIDIGIYDKKGIYNLGIIFDNKDLYPLSLIRFYECRRWKIYRVWSRDLCQDKMSVINNIIRMIYPSQRN